MRLFIFFTMMVIIIPSFAAEDFKSIYNDYRIGEYQKALDSLEAIKHKANSSGEFHYLRGTILFKLEKYDEAASEFTQSINYNYSKAEAHYLRGQSNYALNLLQDALEDFRVSFDQGYSKASSLYYQAHIEAIFERHKQALGLYKKLYELKESDSNFKQIALYQMHESYLILVEKNNNIKKIVSETIIPNLRKAIGIDKKSKLAEEIDNRINELIKTYDLDPTVLKNGKKISAIPYLLSFGQKFRYDSNVTLTSEDPTVIATLQDSLISESELMMKYRFVFDRQIQITPQITSNYTYHLNQGSKSVFQNDGYSISPSIKTTYETKAFDRAAAYLFNVDGNYSARDIYQNHNLDKSGHYYALSFGKQFAPTPTTNTTLTYKYKDYTSYLPASNSTTHSFSMMNMNALVSQNLFLTMLSLDLLNSATPSNNTNTMVLRFDYLIPTFKEFYSIDISHTLILLDPVKQREERGLEYSINPGITISRVIGQRSSATLGYSWTKNTSKDDEAYSYNKHEIEIGLSFKL